MRKAYFTEFADYADTVLYDGDKLLAGHKLVGPCIVEEKMTTIVVPPNFTMTVDAHGNYINIAEG